MESEVLIVGAGIFGISTAYHLAKRLPNPSSITILDRAPAPSSDAASTDINKIIRADYSNPLYMKLGLEAIDAWKNDPLFKDAGVYHQTGWIMMNERDTDLAERIRKNFQEIYHSDPLQPMSEDEVRGNWGGVLKDADLSPFGSYFFNPLAGWADAGLALKIMANEAIRMGVRYDVGEAARLVLGAHGVESVETKTGQVYTADKVLLCAGAWTNQLMNSLEEDMKLPESERTESQITAAGVCVAHVQLTGAEQELYNQLPVYVYGGQGEVLPPTDAGVLKFTNSISFTQKLQTTCKHVMSFPPFIPVYEGPPPHGHQAGVPYLMAKECADSIRPRLPRIFDHDRKVDWFRDCWDAITADQHPLITRHPNPRLANLYLAVGGSFHCWKFLPTMGWYVANVLDGVSNGADRDEAWAWKQERKGQGVHDKLTPTKDVRSYCETFHDG